MTDAFTAARDALLSGNREALAAALDADPALVSARHAGAEPPYCGYFHRATLLHHVAGNPELRPQPDNDVALAALLLERGADIDAVTGQGPGQPDDIGWTTLGLVATSGQPGQLELLDYLIAAGADLEARNGGALKGAIYYQQWDAAERLIDHGAAMDLAAAAALGRTDLVRAMLADDGVALLARPRLAHYSLVPLPASPTVADLLAVALAQAALGGQRETAALLIERGADVDARPFFDHRATALHWAVLGDHPAMAAWLLDQGADRDACDGTWNSTPLGWAEHLGRKRCKELLKG